MSEIANFPTIHDFLLCPKCDSSQWFVNWPRGQELAWYLECGQCGQQYKQGLVTGLETPFDNPLVTE